MFVRINNVIIKELLQIYATTEKYPENLFTVLHYTHILITKIMDNIIIY